LPLNFLGSVYRTSPGFSGYGCPIFLSCQDSDIKADDNSGALDKNETAKLIKELSSLGQSVEVKSDSKKFKELQKKNLNYSIMTLLLTTHKG
jgi:hypothetical protein